MIAAGSGHGRAATQCIYGGYCGRLGPQKASCGGVADHLFECNYTSCGVMTHAPQERELPHLPHLGLAGSPRKVGCKWGWRAGRG